MSVVTSDPLPEFLEDIARNLPLTLSTEELAQVLRVSRRTAQRIMSSGAVRTIRTMSTGSARVMVPRSEVLRWLTQHAR